VHPGHTLDEVIEHTGFDFDRPDAVPTTPAPAPETLELMRTRVAHELAEVYPQFAAAVFGIEQDSSSGACSLRRTGTHFARTCASEAS
jgi:glutaconate CoA-transferase subunit B